jgi:hypothetical protein
VPDNPTVKDLLTRTAKVTEAQTKLREAMAAVAAEVRAAPPVPPKQGKQA